MFVTCEDVIGNTDATDELFIGKDMSSATAYPYIAAAWANREQDYLGWKDVHFSDITGEYATIMSEAMYYDPTDDGIDNGEYIGVMTFIMEMDSIWKNIAFKTEAGVADDEEYD